MWQRPMDKRPDEQLMMGEKDQGGKRPGGGLVKTIIYIHMGILGKSG